MRVSSGPHATFICPHLYALINARNLLSSRAALRASWLAARVAQPRHSVSSHGAPDRPADPAANASVIETAIAAYIADDSLGRAGGIPEWQAPRARGAASSTTMPEASAQAGEADAINAEQLQGMKDGLSKTAAEYGDAVDAAEAGASRAAVIPAAWSAYLMSEQPYPMLGSHVRSEVRSEGSDTA